jgi:uncharacterized membrane protein
MEKLLKRGEQVFKNMEKLTFRFLVGGLIYWLCEVCWRGHSYWQMFFVGGLCFVLICAINKTCLARRIRLLYRGLLATFMILAVEFVSGYILNIVLNLNIWDYSAFPCNILGQVCPEFAVLWFLLSIAAIVFDAYLRYWFFGGAKPQYNVNGRRFSGDEKKSGAA